MAIRITGMNSGLDTDSMVKELVNAYEKQGEKYTKNKTKLEWKEEAWKELNTKVKSFVNKSLSNMRFSSNYNKKKTTASDSSKVDVVSSSDAITGVQSLEIERLASAAYLTGSSMSLKEGLDGKVTKDTKLSDLGFDKDGTITLTKGSGASASSIDISVNGDMTVGDFVRTVGASGINASFDASTGRIFLSSKASGAANDFNLSGDMDALNALGLGDDAAKSDAENAKIYLNGAAFESDSNTFSINNLTITAKEKTNGNKISLSTENDYDDVYNNIKDFFKEYNSLMKQFETLYNAESAKDYEPLTDEEKEAMSDDEIEKWETKIKSALLRRDETLGGLINTMRDSLIEAYDINGTKMSLSSFGINTLSYFLSADNEKGVYHIDGDPDDEETSAEKDKLKKMIASDPDSVSKFFQKLTTNMYDKMTKLSRSSSYRSYGNYFDDKKLTKDIDTSKKKVSDWEDKVAKYEEKYYKQFTAMEKAMGTMNSQQNYMSSILG